MLRVGPSHGLHDLLFRRTVDFAHEVIAPLGRDFDAVEPVQASDDGSSRTAGRADGDIQQGMHVSVSGAAVATGFIAGPATGPVE